MDVSNRVSLLKRATAAGGQIAARAFRTDHDVETKDNPLDAVTETDRDVQRRVLEVIGDERPTDPVVGEEEDVEKTVPEDGPAWIVDPIDGTNNYVAGSRTWAVAAAATDDGEPVASVVHMPALGETLVAGAEGATRNGTPVSVSERDDSSSLTINPIYGFSAEERQALSEAADTVLTEFGDLRRLGCAQAVLAGVAAGELEAAVSTVDLDPWDTVAGVHLVRAAGGTVTDLDGDRWRHDSTGLVASNGTAHEELVRAFDVD